MNLFRRLLSPAKSLTRSERWTLAAGGVLTEVYQEPFDRIETRTGKKVSQICLSDWWEITDRKSLFERLEWLREEGHRTNLKLALARVEHLLAGVEQGDKLTLSKHGEFIVNHLHLLRRFQFTAWDHSRLINIARWGLRAEYLSQAEAWQWAKAAAAVIRLRFNSWKDVGDDFILGYRYWALDAASTPSVFSAYKRLVAGPKSPWNHLRWAIDPGELHDDEREVDSVTGVMNRDRRF